MLDFPFSPRSSSMPQSSATSLTIPSDIWVLRLSQTTRHGAVAGAEANRSFMKATKSSAVRIADRAADRYGGDIECGDQCFGAVPDVFELTPFDMPWLHGQAFGGPFQGLDPGHLVNRNGLTALLGHGGRRLIHRANVGALLVEAGVRLWCQPITTEMRLDVRGF